MGSKFAWTGNPTDSTATYCFVDVTNCIVCLAWPFPALPTKAWCVFKDVMCNIPNMGMLSIAMLGHSRRYCSKAAVNDLLYRLKGITVVLRACNRSFFK